MQQKKALLLLTIFILATAFSFSYIIENLIKSQVEEIKYDTSIIKTKNGINDQEYFTLEKVIDWDTIKIKSNESNTFYTIRMIGLDAPEKSTTRYWYTECFWEQATEHLSNILSWSSKIELEYDPSQSSNDKYWRTLAYVILSWNNINKKMIEDGFCFEYTYNIPYKYQKEFKKAENYARINNLWLRSPENCNWERIPIEKE